MVVGRVYKIICGLTNDIYVGSTLNVLKHRFNGHKNAYKSWLEDRSKSCISIFPLFEQYGLEHFKIVLIKEYAVVDRSHLHALEQLWMNKLKRCTVNKIAAFIPTSNAYKELVLKVAISAKKKVYHEANRTEILAKKKVYRDANKDEINAKTKVYREANRDVISAKKKVYREANRDVINAKYTCDCGGKYIHANRLRHLKTAKHQRFLQDQ
jgi:hypothetical protein